MNQLQAVALNEGLRSKKRLWREHGREQLESFRSAPWASRRRQDLLALRDLSSTTTSGILACEVAPASRVRLTATAVWKVANEIPPPPPVCDQPACPQIDLHRSTRPQAEQRDLRTLLRDRHQRVRIRTRVQNTLQAIALNHALRRGRGLWTATGQKELQALSLPRYTRQRRDELLRLYVQLQRRIQKLDGQVEKQVQQRSTQWNSGEGRT
jgi:hypothetical protein